MLWYLYLSLAKYYPERNMQNLGFDFANPNIFKIAPQKWVSRWLVNPLLPPSPPGSLSQTPVLNFHTPVRHSHPNSETSQITFMSLLCGLISLHGFYPLPTTCLPVASPWRLYSKLSLTPPSLSPLHCSNLLLDHLGCHLNSASAFPLAVLTPVRNVNILVSLIKESSALLCN